jgi:hypothetical protein
MPDQPTAPPLPAARVLKALPGMLALAGTLAVLVPWVPSFPGAAWAQRTDTTASWQLALHHMFATGMQHGRDVIFPYGPWGFALSRMYHPATYPAMLGAWVLIALACFCGAWTLATAAGLSGWRALGWYAAVGIAAILPFQMEPVFFIVGPLLLLHHFRAVPSRRFAVMLLLCVALGLDSLVKFSHQMLAFAVVGVILIDDLLRRRPPWAPLVYLMSLLAFWVLAGQQLRSFWPYVRGSWELSQGYSEAMAFSPPGSGWATLGFVVAAVIIFIEAVRDTRGRPRPQVALFLCGLLATFFIAFKAGCARADSTHLIAGWSMLFTVTMAYWVSARRFRCATLGAVAVAALVVAILFAPPAARSGAPPVSSTGSERRAPALATSRTDSYFRGLAEINAAYPLPIHSGTADVYPHNQAALIASGLEYNPRPVFQSYAAYTPKLAAANALHLQASAAPQWILFTIAPIDGRYPSLEDGVSWPQLLTRYGVRAQSPGFLVLERLAQPRSYHLVPIAETDAHLGESLSVPNLRVSPVWAEIDLRPTAIGKLLSSSYKAPELAISVTCADSQTREFRLVAPMARAGFLLSPLVRDRADFAALASRTRETDLAGQAVTGFKVRSKGRFLAGRAYDLQYHLRLYRLEFPHADSDQQ